MSAFAPDIHIQIDVKEIKDGYARCNMYTGGRCVQIVMLEADYKALRRDGFFIRNGNEKDSAGVLNTTEVFIPEYKKAPEYESEAKTE